ncbi:hypothetical protein [Paenibacillus sp. L3-i20]|uniref:hypothetical protein n=1 Tax=Paenibacillus sp. L3-i20 TaxID=2905833 RepID=UPI001EE02168|nr:hypothetical protein [Paenibacillus sp. L3-i20]GKU80170.1 hypothetical protein L3i20_v245670 [Paenibacillus sp. L3-i20]
MKFITPEEYKARFDMKWNHSLTLKSLYNGSQSIISIECSSCGNESNKPASEAIRYGCVHCSRIKNSQAGRNAQKTPEKLTADFITRLSKKFGNKYSLIGEYVDAKTSTRLRCRCSREFNARPDDLLYGKRGCNCELWKAREEAKNRPPKPKREPAWTHDKFVNKVKEIWGDEFEVIGTWENMHEAIKVKHSICGEIINKRADSLLNGRGCRLCSRNSMSATVILICKILDELGVVYKREVRLDGCRYKNPLFFDFAIYKDSKLDFLIEYDGEQHFRATKYMGGTERLLLIKKRDEVKEAYCWANKIPLLRLNYKMIKGTGDRGRSILKDVIRKSLPK